MIDTVKTSKIKILVVENSPVLGRDLKQSLLRLGYWVSGVAKTRKEALEWIHSVPVDLVLIDIQLKKKTSGIHVSREIQSQFELPVVFLSDVPEEKILNQLRDTTPDGFLLKPYKDAELKSEIEIAYSQFRQQKNFKVAEKRYRLALMSTGYGILLADEAGNVMFVNEAARPQIGYSKQDKLIGKSLENVIQLKQMHQDINFKALAETTLKQGKQSVLSHCQIFNRQLEVWTDIAGEMTPIWDENRDIVGMGLIFRVVEGIPASF